MNERTIERGRFARSPRRAASLALAALHTALLGVLAADLAACGAGGSSPEGSSDSTGTGGSGATAGSHNGSASGGSINAAAGGTGGSTGGGGGSGGSQPPPPEKELESAFEAPVATDRYVWTANPTTGKIALIGAEDYSVRLAEAGLAPTTVAALPTQPDEDAAIVLNAGSDDATILRVNASGEIESTMLKTHSGANAVKVSPSGNWAVIWTNAALVDPALLDPTDGLQDLTIVALTDPPVATVVSVGYRPSAVSFDSDETRVLAVTEPGLTVVDLGDDPTPSSLIDLTDDPVDDPAARDVSVTPDGSYALVRVEGRMALGVVSLLTGERQAVALGDYVTDLDLSADGSQAFAVVGGELVVIPVPPGDLDPQTFARASAHGEIARSVSLSSDASLALLYSNAGPGDPYVGILTGGGDWRAFEGRAVDLKAPVEAVFASPDALHGIAFQSTAAGSTKGGAFSILSAQLDRAPKIVGTDAAPMSLAFSPDGADAVITTRDLGKQSYGTYLVHLANLEQTFYPLSSPPLSAGMVPKANSAFVAQAHPEGRITFVKLTDGSQHTLTGFELTAKVTQ